MIDSSLDLYRCGVRLAAIVAIFVSAPRLVSSVMDLRYPLTAAARGDTRDLNSYEAYREEALRNDLPERSLAWAEGAVSWKFAHPYDFQQILPEVEAGIRQLYWIDKIKTESRVRYAARRDLYSYGALAAIALLVYLFHHRHRTDRHAEAS